MDRISSTLVERTFGDHFPRIVRAFAASEAYSFRVPDQTLVDALREELTFERLREEIAKTTRLVWVFFRDRSGAAKQIQVSGKAALDLHAAGYTMYYTLDRDGLAAELTRQIARALDEDPDQAWPSVFISKKGAITPMHFDAGNGITIQLRGQKTWTTGKNTIIAPPDNYTVGDAWLMELASLQIAPPNPPANDAFVAHALQPGDGLVAAAGMWHQVECIEDSISVDLNLRAMNTRWIDALSKGIRRILTRIPEARRHWGYGEITSVEEAAKKGDRILDALRRDLAALTGASLLEPAPYEPDLKYSWNPFAIPSQTPREDGRVDLSIEIVGFYATTGTVPLDRKDALFVSELSQPLADIEQLLMARTSADPDFDSTALLEALCALQALVPRA